MPGSGHNSVPYSSVEMTLDELNTAVLTVSEITPVELIQHVNALKN